MIINQQVYDGKLIHERFAYKFFRKDISPAGNIVAFRAPMYVSDALIDLEDSLEKDFIYSEDAINFCWEIPNVDPFGAVSFQRWFNANISTILGNMIHNRIVLKGDDIFVQRPQESSEQQADKSLDPTISNKFGKASVSITCSKNGVALGHTGINIRAGYKAPSFAFSTNLTDTQATTFMNSVVDLFNDEVKDIWVATSKVIV